jgi:predicted esterase
MTEKLIRGYVPGLDFIIYSPNECNYALPVIIVLHAGGGKKEDFWPTNWAKNIFPLDGFIGITPDYKVSNNDNDTLLEQRLSTENIWKLITYLHLNHGILCVDRSRIGVLGQSYGGMTAAHAGIGLNDRKNDFFSPYYYPERMKIYATASVSGGVNFQFLNFINKGDPSHLFLNGDQDEIFKIDKVIEAYEMMELANTDPQLEVFQGADHTIGDSAKIQTLVVNHFNELL